MTSDPNHPTDDVATDLLAVATPRRGHFAMESGHHGDTWLDLDALFARPAALAKPMAVLADQLSRHDLSAVCGPLVGGAFVAQGLARAMAIDGAWTAPVAASSAGGLYGVRYRLPASLAASLRGRRVALVDDAMSAGSSLGATLDAVTEAGGIPVVVGALLVLGTRGRERFARLGLPVVGVAERPLASWAPDDCPLCAAGIALEQRSP